VKLKGCHFNTIEVIEAELQAMLNTLTEHNFQDAFKNGRSSGNTVYVRNVTTSRVWGPVGPKLVLDQMAAPVAEIMDTNGIIRCRK
jgi:hypothetical protein